MPSPNRAPRPTWSRCSSAAGSTHISWASPSARHWPTCTTSRPRATPPAPSAATAFTASTRPDPSPPAARPAGGLARIAAPAARTAGDIRIEDAHSGDGDSREPLQACHFPPPPGLGVQAGAAQAAKRMARAADDQRRRAPLVVVLHVLEELVRRGAAEPRPEPACLDTAARDALGIEGERVDRERLAREIVQGEHEPFAFRFDPQDHEGRVLHLDGNPDRADRHVVARVVSGERAPQILEDAGVRDLLVVV